MDCNREILVKIYFISVAERGPNTRSEKSTTGNHMAMVFLQYVEHFRYVPSVYFIRTDETMRRRTNLLKM